MSLLVTGTIGIDTVETPSARADEVLGGSAAYFAMAASLLTPVRLVAVVGDDFPTRFREAFKGRPIDLSGLETRAGSKTFRWHGKYHDDLNVRDTLRTDLNVIAESSPKIPDSFRDSAYIFLANTHPTIQREFIDQLRSPKLVVCDTMDLWINTARDDLLKTFACVHGVVINDGEARQLTEENDLITAGRRIMQWGPEFVAIKKGEHGGMLITPGSVAVLPPYPTTKVIDPNGAGDTFAAGFMGFLAATDRTDAAALKSAMARGACLASITIEGFSMDALKSATRADLDKRLQELRTMLAFD